MVINMINIPTTVTLRQAEDHRDITSKHHTHVHRRPLGLRIILLIINCFICNISSSLDIYNERAP